MSLLKSTRLLLKQTNKLNAKNIIPRSRYSDKLFVVSIHLYLFFEYIQVDYYLLDSLEKLF